MYASLIEAAYCCVNAQGLSVWAVCVLIHCMYVYAIVRMKYESVLTVFTQATTWLAFLH